MDLVKEQYWVIEPSYSSSETFNYTGLVPRSKLQKGQINFIVVPYLNPANQAIQINYFEAKTPKTFQILESEIDFKPVFKNTLTRQMYLQQIAWLKNQIQLGIIYEINYCTQFKAKIDKLDVTQVFKRLLNLSDVPFNYLIKLKHEYILCCSPETYLKKHSNKLVTKPIKGTIRRGNDLIEDDFLKMSLTNSLKDKTEHVMAVDVARNDLSIIANKGSVEVKKLYNIESFKTVHQMVTEVECTLGNQTSIEDIIAATFPMASMTGAPKQSAMNLIDQTEQFERNYYSGTFGFIQADGCFNFPVVIRSLFYNELSKELSFSVGGAITSMSNPEAELEECLLKAQTMIKAVNAELIWD